jgi:hypothetical protein
MFDASDFEISAAKYPTHYSPVGNLDVLDIVVHKNIRLSNVIVSGILDSDHLPIIFHILDHVRTKTISAPLEIITDLERFQSLTSNLISPRIEINSVAEADNAARAFTASIASAYRLSITKITLSELNNDLPGLDRLLKYKKMMIKLRQESRNLGCKKTANYVSKSIRRMTRKKPLEGWKTKLGNTELTNTSSYMPIAKSPTNRDGPKAPTAIHGPPVPGGYKYGNLALQVVGVSNETVKCGREFCGTSTEE